MLKHILRILSFVLLTFSHNVFAADYMYGHQLGSGTFSSASAACADAISIYGSYRPGQTFVQATNFSWDLCAANNGQVFVSNIGRTGDGCAAPKIFDAVKQSCESPPPDKCPPVGEKSWDGAETTSPDRSLATCIDGCGFNADGGMYGGGVMHLIGPFTSTGACTEGGGGTGAPPVPDDRCSYKNPVTGLCEAACPTGQYYGQVPTGAMACIKKGDQPPEKPKDKTCPFGYKNISSSDTPNCVPEKPTEPPPNAKCPPGTALVGSAPGYCKSNPETPPDKPPPPPEPGKPGAGGAPGSGPGANGGNGASGSPGSNGGSGGPGGAGGNGVDGAPGAPCQNGQAGGNGGTGGTGGAGGGAGGTGGAPGAGGAGGPAIPGVCAAGSSGPSGKPGSPGAPGPAVDPAAASDFCKKNPGLDVCTKSAVTQADCTATVCTGDAIQCAILRQNMKTWCENNEKNDQAKLGSSMANGSDPLGSTLPGRANGTTLDFSSTPLDSSGFLGGGSCIADKTFTVSGMAVKLPFAQVCPYLLPMRAATMIAAFLAAYFMLSGVILRT